MVWAFLSGIRMVFANCVVGGEGNAGLHLSECAQILSSGEGLISSTSLMSAHLHGIKTFEETHT